MTRLILLDRDGVINFNSPDYVKSAAQWRPLAGALAAIAQLKQAGYLVGVCTNQAGIGRNLFTVEDLSDIHTKMYNCLGSFGVALDGLEYCPHTGSSGCNCRKPAPGMLLSLMHKLDTVALDTCFVGDSLRDMQAALNAGCQPVLVRTGNGASHEASVRSLGVTQIFDDLSSFAVAAAEHRL
jgi:D-glycero-D-manno-heptose 1,7-bisphosphate phosphatase